MMYLHTKNEVARSRLSKVIARTGQTHTHTHTHRQTNRQTDATERITTSYFIFRWQKLL